MLLLAIDSSTTAASVALQQDELLVGESLVQGGQRHSVQLMPLIDQLLQRTQRTVEDLDAVAVSIGPGSFTGLRVGLAAAKGLCMALDLPLIGVSTLQVLAHNLAYSQHLICPVIYARKREIYTALYDCSSHYPQALSEEKAIPPQELLPWVEKLRVESGRSHIVLVGDGITAFYELWEPSLAQVWYPAAPHFMLPRASALAALALEQARQGQYLPYQIARPVYLRLSEAEYQLGQGEV